MNEGKSNSNYAINPTPELDLRSNRAILPARVIAALDVGMRMFGRLVALAVFSLTVGNNAFGLSLSFESKHPRFDAATQEYKQIWLAYGPRIEKLLGEATGVSLGEEQISVIVFEGVSSSGVAGKAMHLRASYSASVKRATLVHELSHRYIDALNLDPTCYGDVHEVVSPLLVGVWGELWGRGFVEEQAAVEMARSTRYAQAWKGVLGMSENERARKLADFLSSCRRPTMHSSRLRNRLFAQFRPSCRNGLMRR